MATIPLRNRAGEVVAEALVDDEDLSLVSQWRWRRTVGGYVSRGTRVAGQQRTILLHHQVLGIIDGREVDHINGDSLDCRRANLREITHAGNLQNRRGANRGSRSRHRGVTWDKRTGRWLAQVMIDGRNHFLGRFDDEDEAGAAAAAFRAEHMPYATV